MKPMTERELLTNMGLVGTSRAVRAVIEYLRSQGCEDAARELESRWDKLAIDPV